MVFFAIEMLRTPENEQYLEKFNQNLVNGNIAGVMFKEKSRITFINDAVAVVYLQPVIPKTILYYIIVLLFAMAVLFNVSSLFYVLAGLVLLMLSFKYIVFWLFKKGLRRQGFVGEVKVL